MVGQMIMRTPEFASANCKVSWGTNLDRALEGADALYVTMAVGSPAVLLRSSDASMRHGFISNDQMSLTGAFLALTAGPTILQFARKMERICPNALMLIFANPSAIYSGIVNSHTRIQALGVCGGYGNHRWDLTRLMGRNEYCDDYDVDVAGINHLSFILRGTYRDEDLYKALARYLKKGWIPPRVYHPRPIMISNIRFALRKLNEMFQRFGTIIFSTEGDGMAHLFYEEMFKRVMKAHTVATTRRIEEHERYAIRHRKQIDSDYQRLLASEIRPTQWSNHGWLKWNSGDVTIPILKALAGMGRQKIVASRPNDGAVMGFKDNIVLEYSQWIDGHKIRAAGKYALPDCFQGLISALASFQTLIGDAVASHDPEILADGLFSYPIKQNTKDARSVVKELLAIHRSEIPSFCQKAAGYF
jgi:6-phospho-beta-glucosidase